jgi:hypothetical protein
MKKKDKLPTPPGKEKVKGNPEGYPLYPDRDDIYKKFHEDKSINQEDKSRIKGSDPDDEIEPGEELDFEDDEIHDNDLDVPGSELDDDEEEIGSEDEENNYYSIGGDRHEDLEEDDGE